MKNVEKIGNPVIFFEEKGLLHDAELIYLKLRVTDRIVELTVEDINAAFTGHPNYGGAQMKLLTFLNAKALYSNIDLTDGITISKAYSFQVGDGFICDFQLRYGGAEENVNGASLRITFESMSVASCN